MESRINNLDELIVFIENHNLTNNQLNSLLFRTLSVLCIKEIGRCYTKEDLIKVKVSDLDHRSDFSKK